MPTPDDYRWLVSSAATRWLDQAAEPGRSLLSLTGSLRAELTADQTHLVLEQAALRSRAREKFAAATQMFFTRIGLEQATDEVTAAYKAARFPLGAPSADLCCGIGGDFLAIARRGPAVAVDRDPVAALFARHNACGLLDAQVASADVADYSLAGFAAWHLDPDRRPEGRRTTRVELYEPGLPVVARLLAEQPTAAVKLAPAANVPVEWSQQAELEWISRRGECCQLVAWFGNLAIRPGQRAATILGDTPAPLRTVVGQPDLRLTTADQIGPYVYEANAAVLAAHLAGELARQLNLTAIEPHGGYLTGDPLLVDGALATFAVRDVLAFDRKRLRAYCREHCLGRLEIKKRGIDVDPARLRQELAADGPESAVLLLAPFHGEHVAIIANRVI